MATLYAETTFKKEYYDSYSGLSQEDYRRALEVSTTVYVGNLSFRTEEEQVLELFSKCGEVRKVIIGLDRLKRTPCGFCFVEFWTRADTEKAVKWLNQFRLDDRQIRVDFDWGFREGRQFGRAKSGGQVVVVMEAFTKKMPSIPSGYLVQGKSDRGKRGTRDLERFRLARRFSGEGDRQERRRRGDDSD